MCSALYRAGLLRTFVLSVVTVNPIANNLHCNNLLAFHPPPRGMCERLKQAVLKTAIPERVSGVRIPLPPPFSSRVSSPASRDQNFAHMVFAASDSLAERLQFHFTPFLGSHEPCSLRT